ncbi:polyprenyl diphosphate synthase [Methanocella arvoryzae]|uniref:Undecaprenyl pyrophosphate synthetase n=1 Tax=Methanocella arvoryzae (strain DSM 22066 / NBRC 105507 / MRE50) TaxID=351160 RepID=Q0W5V2_METAR|nr:polyprenyl diphosphate synthase [Methanocella arvoryzae]CAJ36241.1 undecaprenyl pyrophosphate synthetase [Methanocella arvoryzae MRE50]
MTGMLARQIAYRFYEKSMLRSIKGERVPKCIAVVVSDADLVDRPSTLKLASLAEWCTEMGVGELSIYVSTTEGSTVPGLADCIYQTLQGAGFPGKVVSPGKVRQLTGHKPLTVSLSIGYGGKHELTNALREIMEDVRAGKIQPKDIDEAMVEAHLIFRCEPDLFIRTGEERLSDFLIWQSVYSELYFTDVNWEEFRKVDLLRAIRDYQLRQRRFGK